MPIGQSPVFSIELVSEDKAKRLPSKLKLFHHATSLGGTESLIEWRAIVMIILVRNYCEFQLG